MSFFKTEDLSKSFGGLIVIEDLSFSLSQGEVMGIIGPDGLGKTTLFNLVAGYIKPDKGSLQFSGIEVTNKRPFSICKVGIARTFQLVKPFLRITALENVMAGRSYGRGPSKSLRYARAEANEVLGFVGLGRKTGKGFHKYK